MGFWDAVASAGPYANNPDRQPHQHLSHHSMFTGRMSFLTSNQQCQSTEGNRQVQKEQYKLCVDALRVHHATQTSTKRARQTIIRYLECVHVIAEGVVY